MGQLLSDAMGELDRLYDKLETDTIEFGRVAVAAAHARADYKLEYTKAFFEATGTLGSREKAADLGAMGYYRRKEVAEAVEKSQRLVVASTNEQIGACRTVVSSHRSV
jgi:aldehyde:ferredoxin oxidoreductase